MICEKCGVGEMVRIGRSGLLEKQVYSRFGFYPWTCAICNTVSLRKDRGERRKKKRTPDSEREFRSRNPKV